MNNMRSFYDHPAFNGIDKNFLLNVDRTLRNVSGKDPTEVLAAVMAISNEAKRYNVQMTPERQQALMMHLRNCLPVNKRTQFDALLRMMMSNL